MNGNAPSPRERAADRALCPVDVANILRLKVWVVARAMRRAGVSDPLTPAQARAWRTMRQEPPAWLASLMADAVSNAARREHQRETADFEDQHRILLLTAKVERRLLAGARRIRGHDAERIASDMAVRAMKDLVRADGDVGQLGDLDRAVLRWAGVQPNDRSTWFMDWGHGR